MIQVRYDEEKGIYRDCRFCRGRGCLACPSECDAEYNRQFPNGLPPPIATLALTDETTPAEVADFIQTTIKDALGLTVRAKANRDVEAS